MNESLKEYGDWVEKIRARTRGRQRWESRVRVYEAIRRNPALVDGTVSDLCAAAGTAPSTFYSCFGPASVDRLSDEDPMSVALVEAKSWAFEPLALGVLDATIQLELASREAVISLLTGVVWWTREAYPLSAKRAAVLPAQVVAFSRELSARFPRETGESRWHALITQVVISAYERPYDGAATIRNGVRDEVNELLGLAIRRRDSAALGFIEAIGDYAERLLDPTTDEESVPDEVRDLLRRFTALVSEVSS